MSDTGDTGPRKIKRALISVYDKSGIVEFARALVDEFGVEILSSGGTAKHLKEHDIPVTLVEEVTGFGELLDGRVKTLHPKIHAAILADRDNPEHMRQLADAGIEPIDMVVVNLYPFEKTVADPDCTFEQAIEMIDIGGPCLLRAAAKNHKHVLVAGDPDSYDLTLGRLRSRSTMGDGIDAACSGAATAFRQTSSYDARIATWLGARADDDSGRLSVLELRSRRRLRYGENPHQSAELLEAYKTPATLNLTTADVVAAQEDGQGEFSFNNYVDAGAALELCAELTRSGNESVCCMVKHTNACGVGIGDDPIEVYRRAYLGDPNAAMGGILAVNFDVDAGFSEAVMDSLQCWGKKAAACKPVPAAFFVEVWVAPAFDDDAVEIIRTRRKWGRRVRLLTPSDMKEPPGADELDYKKIAGGFLLQSKDIVGLDTDQWEVATERTPSDTEMADLRLAWLVCKHTKSNAISICNDGMLIGNGAGQMSRVMSCRIATWLAKENGHADKLAGAVAASDAFFPFRDGPDMLMEAGVTAIIQPGGSKRDEETIAACNERGVAMIFTGTRHFRH